MLPLLGLSSFFSPLKLVATGSGPHPALDAGLETAERGRRATIEEEMAALKQQMAALQTQITNIPAGPAGPAGPQGPPGPPGRDGIDGER